MKLLKLILAHLFLLVAMPFLFIFSREFRKEFIKELKALVIKGAK